MGKLRQFIKRCAKPAAMTAVAGTVALSLVVTTPSNAQAFVPPIPVPAVFGATTMLIPELAPVAAALGPVGWGIAGVAAAAMIGVALYETRDTWVPWVEGAFGNASPNVPNGSGVLYAEPGFVVNSATISGNSITGHWTYTKPADAPSGGFTAIYSYLAKCKRTSDNYVAFSVRDVTQGVNRANFTFDFTLAVCPSGWTTLGHIVGGGGGAEASGSYSPSVVSQTGVVSQTAVSFGGNSASGSGTHGTTNTVRYGDMAPEGFNPKSPETKYTTFVECIDSGGTLSTISRDWFGDSPGMVVPSCEAAGKGHGTGKIWVDGFAPGTTANPTRVWDNPAPAVTPGRELCAPTRAAAGCELKVKIDGLPCTVGNWECENWQDVNQNDPGKDGTTPRVSCQYGPYSVPLSTCNPLERAYEPDGAPVNDANTDGNPATRSNTNLDNAPNPTPENAKPQGVPGVSAAAPPVGSTTEQGECFPSGWAAFNPVEWVMKPVGCAMDAAFKPKKDVQTRVTSMQAKFETKVPISWFGGGVTNVSGGACPTNWAFEISGQHVSLICGTPVEGIILAFRPVMGAMLVIAALWPLVRSLFYAAIPILKVNPS